MDKETLSNYGWIVIAVLVLSVMIALATPFGEYIKAGVESTTAGLFDTSEKAMNVVGMSAQKEKPLYSFGALSDIHIDDTSSTANKFTNALNFYEKYGVKMTCISGDITANGTAANFNKYVETRDTSNLSVYAVTGNHEASSARLYKSKTDSADCIAYNIYDLIGQDFCYYLKGNNYVGLTLSLGSDGSIITGERVVASGLNIPNNDVYIFVGILGDANRGLFFEEQLEWLEDVLEENRNNRCFLFEHVRAERLKWNASTSSYTEDLYSQYVSGNISGKYLKPLWGSADNSGTPNYARQFEKLVSHYTNCIWFHGHTHASARIALETNNPTGNIDNYFGNKYHPYDITRSEQSEKTSLGVHISSCAEPRTLGASSDGSEGIVVDVYKDKVVVKYIDFITNEIICEYELDTTLDDIAENSMNFNF